MPDGGTAGEIRAAGALLWRPGGPEAADSAAGVQVAVIHRPKYDDWSFAKGKVEPGEHVLQAAVREVFEETGLRVTLGRRLPEVRYVFQRPGGESGIAVHKRVDYWAAAAADDTSAPFVPNKEVDRLDWLPVGEARQRLSYPHDIQLLDQFTAGPPRSTALILLRHASAGSSSDWPGADIARPLDAVGAIEAEELTGLLRCFGALRVVSSPAERCLATVRSYAAAAGVPVEPEPAVLAAKDGGSSLGRAETAAVAGRLAAAGEPAIVCAHRENLPVLIEAACDQLGGVAPGGPPLRKSEFLVLHAASGQLVAAERHVPEGAGLAAKRPRIARAEIRTASFLA